MFVPDNIIESLLSSVRSRFDQAGDQSPPCVHEHTQMPTLGSRTDVEVRLQQVRSKSIVCVLRFESLEAAIAGIGGGTRG